MPEKEYWPELIGAVHSRYPRFQFIAEAYWDLETVLLEQGFDACYDKRLYDKLAHGAARDVREHLAQTGELHPRLVRFLENHDEPRAAEVFAGAKGRAAAVVLLTVPGQHLVYDGQLDGRKIRSPVHLGHRPAEAEHSATREFYEGLLAVAARSVFRTGSWELCETQGWPDNPSHEQLLAWSWTRESERWLVVVNYSALCGGRSSEIALARFERAQLALRGPAPKRRIRAGR